MAMDLDRTLDVVTCVASVLTFFSVGVTVLPHMKEGMAMVRDMVLWLAFLAVVAAGGWLGIQRLRAEGVTPAFTRLSSLVKASPQTPAPDADPSPAPTADPYYRPPRE
jgi:hypothetical protein